LDHSVIYLNCDSDVVQSRFLVNKSLFCNLNTQYRMFFNQ